MNYGVQLSFGERVRIRLGSPTVTLSSLGIKRILGQQERVTRMLLYPITAEILRKVSFLVIGDDANLGILNSPKELSDLIKNGVLVLGTRFSTLGLEQCPELFRDGFPRGLDGVLSRIIATLSDEQITTFLKQLKEMRLPGAKGEDDGQLEAIAEIEQKRQSLPDSARAIIAQAYFDEGAYAEVARVIGEAKRICLEKFDLLYELMKKKAVPRSILENIANQVFDKVAQSEVLNQGEDEVLNYLLRNIKGEFLPALDQMRLIAKAAQQKGIKYTQARKVMNRLVENDMKTVRELFCDKKYDEAGPILKKLLGIYPEHEQVLCALVDLYAHKDNYQEGIGIIERLIEQRPNDSVVLSRLCYFYYLKYGQENDPAAIKKAAWAAGLACQLEPGSVHFLLFRTMINVEIGLTKEAMGELIEYVKTSGEPQLLLLLLQDYFSMPQRRPQDEEQMVELLKEVKVHCQDQRQNDRRDEAIKMLQEKGYLTLAGLIEVNIVKV
jgi:tetratricopeptide (TPR) repeat protein